MKVKSQPLGHRGYKPGVFLGLLTANAVVQVRNFQMEPQFLAQAIQNMEQRDGIRPPGDSDQNSLTVRQQAMSFDGFRYFAENPHDDKKSAPFPRANQGKTALERI